jgi:hypothetical protein
VIDPGASLALYLLSLGICHLDDQQCFVERICNCGVDCGKTHATQTSTVLEDVISNQSHARFVKALSLCVELGETSVGAVFGENPIERPDRGDLWQLVRRAAG